MSQSFDRLLAEIARRMAAQERAGRIRPPRFSARRRGPTRDELRAAIELADAVLLAQARNLSPMARGALQDAQARRATRTPAGDFSAPTSTPPTPEQLALLEQLRAGQLMREHREKRFGGPQGSYEPSGAKETVAGWLGTLGFLGSNFLGPFAPAAGAASVKLTQKATAADMRRQLLDLSYIPSPPDRRTYPWSLLSEAEVQDVKRRLYGPGGPVAQRLATGR